MNRILLLLPALLAAAALPLAAQDIRKVLPQTPPAAPSPTGLAESAPAAGPSDDELLIPRLKGLRFVTVASFRAQPDRQPEGVETDGFPFLQDPEFVARLKDRLLGKPVTVKTLDWLTRAVVVQYRLHDRPVVTATVPAQNVSGDTLQVVVVEARVHEVRGEGSRWFPASLFVDGSGLRPGDPIGQRGLFQNLGILNQNPFHATAVELAQGPEPGTTDVILVTKDRFPARFYAGYDNTGNLVTGQDRYNFGANYGNFLGLDQQLNYQFTTDGEFNLFRAHSASYVVPLPWHHVLTVFGAYVDTEGHPSGTDLRGTSWQASGRYTAPLPTLPVPSVGDYTQSLSAGYDFKESNNNLEFGGLSVFQTDTDVSQFLLTYAGRLNDRWGVTNLAATFFASPGGLGDGDRTSAFQAARAGAHADYVYGLLTLDRATRLPGDFTWAFHGAYQAASTNLIGSEQFGLGGGDTVRGYLEREANGDTGWLVSNELLTPPVSLSALFAPRFGRNIAGDQLQFLAFWDYGWTRSLHLLPGEDANTYLSGVGGGLRYTVSQYVSVRFDYGWQLTDPGLGDPDSSRGHIAVTISY